MQWISSGRERDRKNRHNTTAMLSMALCVIKCFHWIDRYRFTLFTDSNINNSKLVAVVKYVDDDDSDHNNADSHTYDISYISLIFITCIYFYLYMNVPVLSRGFEGLWGGMFAWSADHNNKKCIYSLSLTYWWILSLRNISNSGFLAMNFIISSAYIHVECFSHFFPGCLFFFTQTKHDNARIRRRRNVH